MLNSLVTCGNLTDNCVQTTCYSYFIHSLLCSSRSAECCNQPVCLSVCLSLPEHISGSTGPISTKFCVRIPGGHGSVLLRRRCITLCTSGFMDDVTFGRDLRNAGKGWQPSTSAINYVTCTTGAESDVYECLLIMHCVQHIYHTLYIQWVRRSFHYLLPSSSVQLQASTQTGSLHANV